MIAVWVGTGAFFSTDDDGSSYCYPPKPLTCALVFLWTVIHFAKYWLGSVVDCVHQVDDVVTRVSSGQTMTRIRSSVSASSMRIMELATGRRSSGMHETETTDTAETRTLIITAQRSFLPLDKVAILSLADVKDLMRYTIDRNRLDFRRSDFLASLTPAAREAAAAMDAAVLASRGPLSTLSTRPISSNSCKQVDAAAAGDMDALMFVAFSRIFAEWRSLRLVPAGYKRYNAAMNMARRDLGQNLQKIETAVHSWMAHKEYSKSAAVELSKGRQVCCTLNRVRIKHGKIHTKNRLFSQPSFCIVPLRLQLSSPTLKQLLVWEKEQNLHIRLPRLMEKSGASGVLWTQRQLQYQTSIFHNLLRIPTTFASSKDAVAFAYKATYEAYHGFLVRSIFQSSFDASPDVNVILEHMKASNGYEQNSSRRGDDHDAATADTCQDDDSSSSSETFVDCKQIPASIDVGAEEKSHVNAFSELGQHLAQEWMKLERFLNQCKGEDRHDVSPRDILLAPSSKGTAGRNGLSSKIASLANIQRAAEEEIPSFLAVVQPILSGLDEMIDKLNMKDPTKC
jgi:Glycolipid transfer protein (GLTP)